LRLAGATGDLWYDEIWSLAFVGERASASAILFGAPLDNNHPLNSLWMHAVRQIFGEYAPALLFRAAGIFWGTLTVPATAWALRPLAGRRGALVGAGLSAVAYAYVLYGSEARGYSGLLLGLTCAFGALARLVEKPFDRQQALVLAISICFGALSHLTMVGAAGALAGAAWLARVWTQRSVSDAAAFAVRLTTTLVAGLAAPVGFFLYGLFSTGRLQLGVQTPFTWEAFAGGLMRCFGAGAGLSATTPEALALPLAGVFVAAGLAVAPARQRVFLAGAILLYPMAVAALRPPNPQFARFYLVILIGFIALASVVAGQALARGGWPRALVVACLGGLLVGNLARDARLMWEGRGDYGRAIRELSAAGLLRLEVNRPSEVGATLRYHAKRVGAPVQIAQEGRADAYLQMGDGETPPPARQLEKKENGEVLTLWRFYPTASLSGFSWAVYRQTPRASSVQTETFGR
jgi:hypothetical protein